MPQTIDLAEAYRRLAKRYADQVIVTDVLEEQLAQSRQQLADLGQRLTAVEAALPASGEPLPFPAASAPADLSETGG